MKGDRRWMSRALDLARRGLGTTSPNPAVGAVLVRDGAVIGEGWTRPAGGDHAEIVALQDARDSGRDPAGATMYVTLEPCCHHGRTPPCTDAILEAGVARVVAGVVDPFPPMQGRALDLLRGAGVEVRLGVRRKASARVVLGFTRAVTLGLPQVTAKAGISLDGRIATAAGESRWITGADAREHGHALRAQNDAILVGIGTVLADDPRLTCRVEGGVDPVPVILDTELRCPAGARCLHGPRRALVVCAEDAPARELPADIARVARGVGGVDVEAALRAVVEHGHHRVLVEGGGQVHRSLLDARLVDELLLYVSGVLVPGGVPWLGGPPLEHLADAVRIDHMDVERVGDDLRVHCALCHALDGEG